MRRLCGGEATGQTPPNTAAMSRHELISLTSSWLTIAIPEFIELLDLPPNDFFRIHLTDTLLAQCSGLRKYQDVSGLWHTILDDDGEDSYLEASASAGFAFGILKGARKRYINKDFEDVAIKAVKAVISNIDTKGELQQVSFGTPIGDTCKFYKTIPLTSMPYGQAMAMMALVEFLRQYI